MKQVHLLPVTKQQRGTSLLECLLALTLLTLNSAALSKLQITTIHSQRIAWTELQNTLNPMHNNDLESPRAQ